MAENRVAARGPRRKLTARQQQWRQKLSSVATGLSLNELSVQLGEPYAAVQRWAAFFAYPIRDGRGDRPSRVDWSAVDWTKSNVAIVRELKVSRERVRQVRAHLTSRLGKLKHTPKAQAKRLASNIEWRLPNRDLARVHRLSAQQVANLRFRLQAGPPAWDARGGGVLKDAKYLAVRAAEERKAADQSNHASRRKSKHKH